MTLIITVILIALVFEYINGFHDTANSIATVVSTKVLTPRQAIILAATTNLFGALVGTAVAKTIASGLVDTAYVSSYTSISALIGAITWNMITWYYGIPSSSSHALIGGIVGAVLSQYGPSDLHSEGIIKILKSLVISPLCGFFGGRLKVLAMLDQFGAERAHGAVLLHRIAARHINNGRNAVAAGREGEALPVIAARGGNDPGRIRPLPLQPVEIDQPAAHLEGADRRVVLMLHPDFAACALGKQRPGVLRRRRHGGVDDLGRVLNFLQRQHGATLG